MNRNMYLALSLCSATGLWLAIDPATQQIVGQTEWSDSESNGLNRGLVPKLEELLLQTGLELRQIQKLFCVSGPGAFTGLRMGSAFMQGLARSLSVSLHPVPSFCLLNSPFYIPLRHQMAKNLSLTEALAQGIEFLQIRGPAEFQIAVPQSGDVVWGLKENAIWPTPAQLRCGVEVALKQNFPFQIHYGLEPKISGARA